MDILSIDFETHSRVDLKTHGAYVYAQDPSTGVYVMSYAFTGQPTQRWVPGDGEPFPQAVIDHITAGGIITAWNAQFERLIFWYIVCPDYDVPEPAIEQFQCTAARARAHGLPGKLGDCARALGIKLRKMDEGTRLINEYSVKNVPWSVIPLQDRALWCAYCDLDVEVEQMIAVPLRELTADEWDEYHVNEHICDAGVPLDMDFVEAAAEYADELRLHADGDIAKLTEGKVTTARKRKSRDALFLPMLSDDARACLEKYDQGEKKISWAEDHRNALASHPDTPELVREYLRLVNEAGGASLRKYQAMKNRAIDGRFYGALMFNGAGQTGRFSSTGLQVHNLKRADEDTDYEQVILDVIEGYALEDPSKTLAEAVRASIYAPEGGLTWGDWSNIEGRVAPWLSNCEHGERKLDVFRRGEDPYKHNAAATFHTRYDEVTKRQRSAGKVQELALQFLGGVGALKVMGRNYGLHLKDGEAARMRDAWRSVNPWAMDFGGRLEAAAMRALMHTNQWFEAGRVAYACDEGMQWLWCRLPCGRFLAYYRPKLEMVETPWGEEKLAVTHVWGAAKPKVNEKWPRRSMHGGRFLENITQATAASLLRRAVMLCAEQGLPLLLHVHDELILSGRGWSDALEEIMLDLPEWAEGLPIEAEVETGTRYGK